MRRASTTRAGRCLAVLLRLTFGHHPHVNPTKQKRRTRPIHPEPRQTPQKPKSLTHGPDHGPRSTRWLKCRLCLNATPNAPHLSSQPGQVGLFKRSCLLRGNLKQAGFGGRHMLSFGLKTTAHLGKNLRNGKAHSEIPGRMAWATPQDIARQNKVSLTSLFYCFLESYRLLLKAMAPKTAPKAKAAAAKACPSCGYAFCFGSCCSCVMFCYSSSSFEKGGRDCSGSHGLGMVGVSGFGPLES